MKLDGYKLENEIAGRWLTPSGFAHRADLSEQTIAKALKSKNISPQSAKKIADALKMDVEELQIF